MKSAVARMWFPVLIVLSAVVCMTAPAGAALVRLDASATLIYGVAPDGYFATAASNVHDNNWENTSQIYPGHASYPGPGDIYVGYTWPTPQRVTNIVYSDSAVEPYTIEWSAGGAGDPSTWTWTTLASYTTDSLTPHLLVDLPNVRGIRVHSLHVRETHYAWMSELGVWGSAAGPAQAILPVADPSFSTALSTNPGNFTAWAPSRLVAPTVRREFWARYQPGGILTQPGPQATWKGSWASEQALGGILLWGGYPNSYYPETVDTYSLYVLKPGGNPASVDYANDWILVDQNLTRVALQNGAATEILFPQTVYTRGVALLETGSLTTQSQYISDYGGHMVLLVGGAALIPEPATLALVVIGAFGLILRRGR